MSQSLDKMLKVGQTYLTQEGKFVKVVKIVGDSPGYKCALGSDDLHRYNRENNSGGDNGRCTRTEHNYSHPKNFTRIGDWYVES